MENENVVVKTKSNKGIIIVLIILLIGACGYIAYDKFLVKDESKSTDNKGKNSVVEKDKNDIKELYSFQSFINTSGVGYYLQSEFDDVSKINMEKVIKYNFDFCSKEKKADEDYYWNILGVHEEAAKNGSINLCSKKELENNFKNLTGKDISILSKDLLPKYYSEQDDAYLFNVSDYYEPQVYVYSLTKNSDGTYLIKYIDSEYDDVVDHKELTLKKSDSMFTQYQLVSHKVIKK